MNNIDRFNETAAEILARLYAEFPRRTSIDFEDMLEADEWGGVPNEDMEFVRDTASWLQESGYIWGQLPQQGLMMATLSPKGLEVLKATPSSIEPTGTIGDKLLDAADKGSRDLAGRLFSEGLSALFRAGIQSVGVA